MANISVRQLDDETLKRLCARASRDGVSMEEEVRSILRAAMAGPDRIGDMALEVFGLAHGVELDLPAHGPHEPTSLDP